MPQLNTYNLFISHAWAYGEDYTRLVNLLDNASYFSYRNYSAPQDRPLEISSRATKTEIKNALDRKIRPASIVLVIAGMYLKHREWMQYEIEKSLELKKPVIAIYPWGNSVMPSELQGLPAVHWNTDTIVQAIRQFSL